MCENDMPFRIVSLKKYNYICLIITVKSDETNLFLCRINCSFTKCKQP